MKIIFPHISFERLSDLAEGLLAQEEQSELLAHLRACADCSSEMAQVERIIGLMSSDTTEDAPRHVILRVLSLFRSKSAGAPGMFRRVLAVLQFDSQSMTPAFGLRAGQPPARQMLFNAEEYMLDLRLSPSKPAETSDQVWTVAGQMLGAEAAGQVELHGATSAVQAELNALSEFTLPSVVTGCYSMTVRLLHPDKLVVVIPELRLES